MLYVILLLINILQKKRQQLNIHKSLFYTYDTLIAIPKQELQFIFIIF